MKPAAAFASRFRARASAQVAELSPWAWARVALYVIVALQICKAARMVPFENLLDGAPLTDYHYSQMYSDLRNDRRFTALSGLSWGYDPAVGAGQPVGAGLSEQSHAAIFLDRLLRRWVPPSTTIKLFLWMAVALGPLLLFLAARGFGLGPATSALAAAIGAAGALSFDVLSRILLYRGHAGFWLAAHLALYNAAAFRSAMTGRSNRGFAAFALTAPFLALLDPAVAFVQAVPLASYVVGGPPKRRSAGGVAIVAAVVLSIALNAFWIRPFLIFQGFSTTDIAWPTRGLDGVLAAYFPFSTALIPSLWAAIRAYLLFFGMTELFFLPHDPARLSRSLGAWTLACGLIGFFGGSVTWFHQLEPGRFVALFSLLLLFPASAFMARVFLAPKTLRVVFFGWFVWLALSWQVVHQYDPYPVRDTFVSRERSLLADLRAIPNDGRRVLVEYDPFITDVLRIGAPSLVQEFVGYSTGWWNTVFGRSAMFDRNEGPVGLFGKTLTSYEDGELFEALARYDVGHIVVTSRRTRAFFEEVEAGIAPLRPFEPDDTYWIFRVAPSSSGRFISGRGRVVALPNRLMIFPSAPAPLVLSYHWLEGMTVEAPASLRPVYIQGDPVPFIGIDNAAGARKVEVRYEPR